MLIVEMILTKERLMKVKPTGTLYSLGFALLGRNILWYRNSSLQIRATYGAGTFIFIIVLYECRQCQNRSISRIQKVFLYCSSTPSVSLALVKIAQRLAAKESMFIWLYTGGSSACARGNIKSKFISGCKNFVFVLKSRMSKV